MTARNRAQVRLAGSLTAQEAVLDAAAKGEVDLLCRLLGQEPQCFGFIVETEKNVIAATDRIRSYPVYIRQSNGVTEVATQTSQWVTPEHSQELAEERVGQFLASGFTFGHETLFGTVRRLLGGEVVVVSKDTGRAEYRRYYFFRPVFGSNDATADAWEGRLETALDNAMARVITVADGARIWVPLSGGYDSRTVLAKLLALGYDRVETFSYGVKGNMEARVACEIAERAGVPWRHIPSLPERACDAFAGEDVDSYYLSASGLGSTPVMTEFFPVRHMAEDGLIGEDDYIVNGQTGDFLTGGHLPAIRSVDEAAAVILNKHLALLQSEKEAIGQDGMKTLLDKWTRAYLDEPLDKLTSCEDALSLCVTFEGQERQSQYVVQQQRLYDFLTVKWALPLWDGEMMDLFQAAPVSQHRKQSLYLRYLRRWNFRGLFDEGRRPYNPWPKHAFLFRTAARLAGLFGGAAGKERAYKHLYYWSEHNYLYALFGRRVHRGLVDDIRGPISLFTLDYMNRLRGKLELEPRRRAEIAYAGLCRTASGR